jgi:hypothetical protein
MAKSFLVSCLIVGGKLLFQILADNIHYLAVCNVYVVTNYWTYRCFINTPFISVVYHVIYPVIQ